jgi:hypothetical protein
MAKTGEPKLSGALEELRTIQQEMENQDIAQKLQVPWMRRGARGCGER